MSIIVIFLLILIFYFDISLMTRQDRPAFVNAFRVPRSFCFVYAVLFLFGAMFFYDQARLYLLMVSFLLPVYLLKRSRYKKLLHDSSSALRVPDEENLLAFDAIGIVLLWLMIMMLSTAFVGGFNRIIQTPQSQLSEVVGLSMWSSLVFLYLIILLIKKHPRLSFLQTFGLVGNRQPLTRLVVFPAICGVVIAAITSCIVFFRQFQPVTPMDEMLDTASSQDALIFFVFSAVLFAPLFEELIFRGFFFYIIKRFKGQAFAICVIAVTFAGLHFDQYWGDPAAIIMVTILGFALTFFRAWTKTSWPSIVMHYTFNGSMMIIPLLLLFFINPSFFQYQINHYKLDPQKKEELLYKSINAQPDFAESYNELAWLFAEESRNLNEALQLIEEALKISPDKFAFLDTKAEVLYKLKRTEEAVEIARDLAERYPSNYYALKQLKKFEQALEF